MKYLLGVFLTLMALAQTAAAGDANRVREDLENKLDAVLGIIETEDLDSQTKQDRVVEIVDPLFDFPLMSYYALGKIHWSTLSKEQRERFTGLFTERLRESYLTRIDLYTNEKITFETPLEEKNKIQIPTRVVTKGDTISIVYKFRKRNNDWKIYDIDIEGVSLISSYRSQFNESLQSGTIEELLTKLKETEAVQ